MKIETAKTEDLHFDLKNANGHEKGIPEISASLREFGQRKPLVVWGDNVVIAGNGMLEAAKGLGWETIEISRTPDDWPYDKAAAYALADNKTQEFSEWIVPVLEETLLELEEFGWHMEEFGFIPITLPEQDASEKLGDVGYAIIVTCSGESEQMILLETFAKEGLIARPLMI